MQSLYFRLNNPDSPSLFSKEGCSIPLNILVASFGLTPTGQYPSCAGYPRAGCSTEGEVSQERRGVESPPLPCCLHCFQCSPGYNCILGCKFPLLGHVQPLLNQHPQGFHCRAVPNLLILIRVAKVCPDPGAARYTWPC